MAAALSSRAASSSSASSSSSTSACGSEHERRRARRPSRASAKRRRLADCDTCAEHTPGRYRCPACDAVSCSLACVQAHKVASGCTGRRARTRFLSLKAFDDAALRSDYGFLEETLRAVDSTKRMVQSTVAHESGLPPHVRRLVGLAAERGVTLELMSAGMSRRQANRTKYDGTRQALVWSVQLRLEGGECVMCAVSEKTALGAVLAELLASSGKPAFASLRERHTALSRACDTAPQLVVLKLKRERLAAGAEPFKIVVSWPDAVLGDVLRGETIIEYPCFELSLAPPADALELTGHAATAGASAAMPAGAVD